MTVIMIIASSHVVTVIAVHIYSMYSNDRCKWSFINVINNILRRSNNI